MSETDTAELDNRNNGDKQQSKFAGFAKSCLFVLFIILGYFFSGTIVLYGCRLAQSCLLPIYENEYPYTDVEREDNGQFWTNLFYSDKGSHHLSFEDGEYKLIPTLVHYRDTINVRFVNYILTNIISLLRFSYSTTDTVLKSVNSVCSENAIIMLSPFILGILSFILMIGNTGYFVYLWFKNLGLFYKDSEEEDGKIRWTKDVSWIFPKIGAFYWSLAFFCLFFFIYPVIPFIVSSLMPIVFLTILSYESVYNDGVSETETSIIGVFQIILKYYKSIVLVLMGLGFSSAASTHLGSGTGSTLFGMVIIIMIMEYFKIINMFKAMPLENLMPSMNFKPAFELVKEKTKQFGGGDANMKSYLKKLNKHN